MTLGLRAKLFIVSLLLIGGVGSVTLIFFESRLRAELDSRVDEELRRRARTAASAVGLVHASGNDLGAFTTELAKSTGGRVAIVDGVGRVTADSAGQLDALDSPPVRRALAGEVALSRRVEGERTLIEVAAPFVVAGGRRGAVWIQVEPRTNEGAVGDLRALILLAGLVGLAVAIFMSGLASELMARTLRTIIDEAVEDATGESRMTAEDSGDDLVPPSRSLNVIAKDLHDAVGELAEERDRLETILEQMHDAVLVLDPDGILSLTNDAANRLLSIDDDDVGRPLLEVVRAPALSEIANRVADGAEDATAEFELNHPAHREVLAHAAMIRNDGGVVIVMHDVTEIRRLERVRRDFVANVSHELRTPVSVIRANAETLLDGAIDDRERARDFVEGIHRSSERLSLLIADLLDLSRIEAGQYATDIRSVAVRRAVEAAVDGLVANNNRSVSVINEVGDETSVRADTVGLNQILQNLLDNAIKYVPDDGHVWVRATPSNDVIRIEVQDDGPGIEPHHRRRVFERFYRIDPGRSREIGGTGLGLAIVKHLAERMGGTVGVEAAPERGSLFWVELPRVS